MDVLQLTWSACCKKWPSIKLSFAAYREFVNHREKASGARTGEPALEDLFLACACASKITAAYEVFDTQLLPQMKSYLRRIDSSSEFVDEAMHRVRVKVLLGTHSGGAKISEYGGIGSLHAWLKAVTVRTGLNMRRDTLREKEIPVDHDALLSLPWQGDDVELNALRKKYRPHFSRALKQALSGLTASERNLLRLHFVSGVSMAGLGTMYHANKSTMSRRLSEIKKRLLSETKATLKHQFSMSDQETIALLKAIDSSAEMSIRSMLTDPR